MTRRFELGPLLVALGALLLLIALFLAWYGPLNAWQAFEITDLLLAALALGAAVVAVGALVPEVLDVDPHWLPWLSFGAFAVVAAELLDPPPVARSLDRHEGAWLALGAVLVMVAGTILTLGRVSLAVAVEGRERRRRVSAVDHRPPPTGESEAVRPSRRGPEPLLHSDEPEAEPGSGPGS